MELKIDDEFQDLVPPLQKEEYDLLEKSILEEGCRDALVIWNGFIIDGHNRYRICSKHNIEFDVVEKAFDSREEVKDWIDANQLGRRNLTPDQRRVLIGRRYNREKKGQGGTGANQYTQSVQNDQSATRNKLAKEYGVSEVTIRRDGKIADFYEQLEKEKPELAKEVWSGKANLKDVKKKQREEDRKKQQQKIVEKGRNVQLNKEGDPKLLEGDILEQVKHIDDNSIDCLITDPPYQVMKDYEWDKPDPEFTDKWLKAIKPKLKNKHTGFIFCDARKQYEFESILGKYFKVKNRLIWIRKNLSMGRVVSDRFISSYEVIFYFGTNDLNLPEVWGDERFDSFEYATPQSNFKEGKYHPTQKPIELYKRLISIGSRENELVVDIFAGSGTAGITCKELNRNCILIEKEQEYIDIIKGRI